jgi:hypothetical protein
VIANYGGRRQAQAVTAQSGYLSVNDRRLHFGLGAAQSADLEIRWPSGLWESVRAVSADRLITLREGAGVVKVESLVRRADNGNPVGRLSLPWHGRSYQTERISDRAHTSENVASRDFVSV